MSFSIAKAIEDSVGSSNVSRLYIGLAVAAMLLVLYHFFSVSMSRDEPPLLRSSIPFVGHLFGMMRYKGNYFAMLCNRAKAPIFTVPLGSSKNYIITTPGLTQAAIRSKTLSFDPMSAKYGEIIFMHRARPEIKKLAGYIPHISKVDTEPYLIHRVEEAIHNSLNVGPHLTAMNGRALSTIAETINGIGVDGMMEFQCLYPWLKDFFTKAFAHALLGARNPFSTNRFLRETFWHFEETTLSLMVSPYPWLTARSTYKSREICQDAIRAWGRAGHRHDPDVSMLTSSRCKLYTEYGFSPDEMADAELSMLYVGTVNAIPTVFWMLCLILTAGAELIEPLRTEIEAIITKTNTKSADGRDIGIATLDITQLSTSCPLLVASYQETNRLVNFQPGVRWVVEDTILKDPSPSSSARSSYTLKKGSMLLCATSVLHHDPAIWGADAEDFNPRRWLDPLSSSSPKVKTQGMSKEQRMAYIPFGGGRHLCPGRHLAWAEILGFVAVMLVGFEVVNGETRKGVRVEREFSDGMTEAVRKPVGKTRELVVGMKRRAGWERVVWEFGVGGDKGGDA